MKKLYYIGMMASLLTLAGCYTDELSDTQIGKEGVTSFTTLNATFGDIAVTRAHLIDGSTALNKGIAWEDDDQISVFSDLSSESTTYNLMSQDGSSAKFAGIEVEGNTFYATYPTYYVNKENPLIMEVNLSSLSSLIDGNNGYRFTFPMVAKSTDNNFTFKQTVGLIHIQVGDIDKITQVRLSSNSGEYILGSGYINLAEEDPTFHLYANEGLDYWASSDIWFSIADDLQSVTPGGYKDLFFAVVPTTLKTGFTLTVYGYDANGNEVSLSKSTSEPLTIDRATVKHYSLINVNEELVEVKEKTRAALKAFYDALDGDNWNNNDNWNSDKPFSEWYGLEVEGDIVRGINLWDNNLIGNIPPEIVELESLGNLSLGNNQITSLPDNFADLKSLTWLDLSANEITDLPASLSSMTSLQGLFFSENELTSFPDIFDLTNLTYLSLSYNKIAGSIPSQISRLKELRSLNLSGNLFEGKLPASLFEMDNLYELFLANNKLSDVITLDMQNTKMWQNLKESQNFDFYQQEGYEIVIEGAVTEILVDIPSDIQMAVGDTRKLTVTVLPADALNKNVKWYSQDENVITIDENGLITAVGEGFTYFYCRAADGNGAEYWNYVTVAAASAQVEGEGFTVGNVEWN